MSYEVDASTHFRGGNTDSFRRDESLVLSPYSDVEMPKGSAFGYSGHRSGLMK